MNLIADYLARRTAEVHAFEGSLHQLLRCLALLVFVSPLACAQPEGDAGEGARLPDEVLGEWSPLSENYWQYGRLAIERDTLTWGTCVEEPYRVLRSTDSAWLIELVRSPGCPFRGPETNLWLEISERGLILSRCQEPNEIEKPLRERSCGWGILTKRSD